MRSNGVESWLVVAVTMARLVESVAERGATSIVTTRQGVVEPRGIHRRRWSRVMAVTAACQRVQTCRPKFGWSLISAEARMGIIYRGISTEAYLQ